MSDLRNIKIFKLFQLPDPVFEKYNSIMRYLIPKNHLRKYKSKDFSEISYGDIILVKRLSENPDFEDLVNIFETVFGIKRKKLLRTRIIDFYHALNHIKKEIETIEFRELKNLNSRTDDELKRAGVEKLNIFGELNTLILLGSKYGKSPEEIEQWSYGLVFSLLLHEKITNDINKNYTEIINKKYG